MNDSDIQPEPRPADESPARLRSDPTHGSLGINLRTEDTDSIIETPDGYKISLDVFTGPMDLLLYLVKKAEVDIWEIPISDLADKYLAFIRLMQDINIELAGEFLVLAASLLEIKSRMLLPNPQPVDGEAALDPRSELIQQLLEYKKFKDASRALEHMEHQAELQYPRLAPDDLAGLPDAEAEQQKMWEELTMWDLMSAFSRIISDIQFEQKAGTIYQKELPVRHYMDAILTRLKERPIASFSEFILQTRDRAVIIGTFLAILELVKVRSIRAEQQADNGDIRLILVNPDAFAENTEVTF